MGKFIPSYHTAEEEHWNTNLKDVFLKVVPTVLRLVSQSIRPETRLSLISQILPRPPS